MKIYHSGNHEGIGFAYALVPEWEKESKERTARDEKAKKEAQKERLRLLEPWEARIDETILAAGYTSPNPILRPMLVFRASRRRMSSKGTATSPAP